MVAFETACFVSFFLSVFVDFDLTLIAQNLHTRKICEPHTLIRPLLCHVLSKLLLLTLKLAAVLIDDDELVVFDLVQFSMTRSRSRLCSLPRCPASLKTRRLQE